MCTPVLKSQNFTKRFVLQTDASDRGVGTVLSQLDSDGIEHHVGYFSRKLLPREERYASVEKECLAIELGVSTYICSADHSKCRPTIVRLSGFIVRKRTTLAKNISH